ncbi:hypothetical protein HDU91_001403 [Kappamyces sp. JEL0680]|nr:hypothetical protein HDU91_001403 [Kappamyces sp. JEL0680]
MALGFVVRFEIERIPQGISSLCFHSPSQLLLSHLTADISAVKADEPGDNVKSIPVRSNSCWVDVKCIPLVVLDQMDAVAGDNQGNLLVLRNGQDFFAMEKVCHGAITCIAVHAFNDLPQIVAADEGGIIVSTNLFLEAAWRCNLPNITGAASASPVRCMTSVVLLDASQYPSHFLLVCDERPQIHFLALNECALTIDTPCAVNSIISGRLMRTDAQPSPFTLDNPDYCQVGFAGENGNIYVLDHYAVRCGLVT